MTGLSENGTALCLWRGWCSPERRIITRLNAPSMRSWYGASCKGAKLWMMILQCIIPSLVNNWVQKKTNWLVLVKCFRICFKCFSFRCWLESFVGGGTATILWRSSEARVWQLSKSLKISLEMMFNRHLFSQKTAQPSLPRLQVSSKKTPEFNFFRHCYHHHKHASFAVFSFILIYLRRVAP